MEALRPYLNVTYNGINITKDISKSLIAFTYNDHLDEADTLDIQLEDSQLLWQNEWYPEKGAKIIATIGTDGGAVIDCGTFEMDEIELSGVPDSVTMRCIAAGFKSGKKRSKKSHVHEQKTLAEIVNTIASLSGLKVEGKISDVRVSRKVQRKETDLRFLRRLANEYGYIMNIRDDKAIFMLRKELESTKAVASFDKTDLLSFSIKDKSTGLYSLASIKYHNPETSELISHQESEGGLPDTDDTIELQCTAATQAEAIMMTKAALNKLNKLQQSGNISLPGSPLLCAGNVIELTGLGLLSGDYMIKSSAHTIGLDTSWISDLEVYKVGFIDKSKHKPKKK